MTKIIEDFYNKNKSGTSKETFLDKTKKYFEWKPANSQIEEAVKAGNCYSLDWDPRILLLLFNRISEGSVEEKMQEMTKQVLSYSAIDFINQV